MAGIYEQKRFLIVEDDPIVASSLKSMLEHYGAADVHVAHGADDACALLDDETLELDAAIVDIDLNGQDCADVSAMMASKAIPFVFHSGRIQEYPHLIEKFRAPTVSKPSSDFDMIFALEKIMGWPKDVVHV